MVQRGAANNTRSDMPVTNDRHGKINGIKTSQILKTQC